MESESLNVLRDWGTLDISLPPKAFHYPGGSINSQRAIVDQAISFTNEGF
jgi:hypothetical protein